MTFEEMWAPAEAGPTSLETRAAIQDCFARYAWCFDIGDAVGVAQLFAEDGEYVTASKFRRGRDQVRQLVENTRSTELGRGKQHWVANSLFSGDGTVCYVRSMGAGARADQDGVEMNFMGFYDDTFTRIDGSWFFKRRVWRNWSEGMKIPLFNDVSDLPAWEG